MKYIVIGLGIFGSNLAEELTNLGHEVVGADSDEIKVEHIKDRISTAFVLDSTEELAISILPLKDADAVIVAIGEHFGSSVKTVALLKQNGVRTILARAIDDVHASVLESLHVNKILFPEKGSAKHLARSLEISHLVSTYQIDSHHYMIQFRVPNNLIGLMVNQMNLKDRFSITMIAIKRAQTTINFLGTEVAHYMIENVVPEDFIVKEGDILVGYGLYKDFQRLFKTL